MDRFIVRRPRSNASVESCEENETAKRPRVDAVEMHPHSSQLEARNMNTQATTPTGQGDPRTIISWNVNGLLPQLKNSWSEIQAFLQREQPDVLCLQEVRIPARGPKGAKRGDGQKRQRGIADQDTKQGREDWDLVLKTLIAATKGTYDVHWSLADYKYAGTALLVRCSLRPSSVRFALPALSRDQRHRDPADAAVHPEGRTILAAFKSFDLLATYAPNNGSDSRSFERRACWDAALLEDLSSWARPLIWIGDLNCAPTEVDVTEPDWFLHQCYQGDPPDMRGQPGFTVGERNRFRELVSKAKLVDTYRFLHPAEKPPPAESPSYTWRGHPPVHGSYAKYHGKGMRIDHALVTETLLPRVEASDILGHGAARVGFLGSDHCPVKLVLSQVAEGAPVDVSGNHAESISRNLSESISTAA